METRLCAHCGSGFPLNPRARAAHTYCPKVECQRERRRAAQQARRARDGRAPLSDAGKASHAACMRSCRREAARILREEGSVTEAGFGDEEPARVYVVRGPGPEVRLRLVTRAGVDVVIDAKEASGRVTEAG